MARGTGIGTLGRAPVPEWEEVARAAWPGRLPVALTTAAGRAYLPVFALSLVVLVLAAWLRLPWLGLAAWTVGAAGDWLATPADPPVVRLLDLVGLRAQLRALLRSIVAAVLVFAAAPDPLAGSGYVASVLFIQLAWTAQPVLATWLSRSTPPLRYVPGAATQPQPFAALARACARGVGTPGIVVALEFVVLAKALATATGWMAPGLDLATDAVVVLLALGWLAWTAAQARGLRASQPRWSDALLADLNAEQPSFLVHISMAARQSRYIVNQWLPPLEGVAPDGLLLVREASQLAQLGPSRHAVVYAPSQNGLDAIVRTGPRAAFYLAYGERNVHLLRHPRLTHVLLAHGDSDKNSSANNTARAFSEIWVAGPAAIDRFRAAGVDLAGTTPVVIGRPQVAGLPTGRTAHSPAVVLYAPTFEGYAERNDYSSLASMGPELVRRLVGVPDVQVWFRPHPASGTQRGAMLEAIRDIEETLRHAPGGHVVTADRGLGLEDCLAEADVLVTDISAVASDYLFTERPIIVCNPTGLPPDAFVAAHPSQASSYLLAPDLADLDGILARALGDDPLRDARIAMKRHVLGDPPGGPQAAFAANVARVCEPGVG